MLPKSWFFLVQLLKIVIVTSFFFLFVLFFIISLGRTNGRSMERTLFDDDVFFVNKIGYLLKWPSRFDIVQYVDGDRRLIIKRIIGLPGETIVLESDQAWVLQDDGWYLQELTAIGDEVIFPLDYFNDNEFIVIPENMYYVLGDNREQSIDSRQKGFVGRNQIVGEVLPLKF